MSIMRTSAFGIGTLIPEERLTVPVSSKRDHCQGPDTAPVTLLEYGDYECPYCGKAYAIIRDIQGQVRNQMRFVFRNFPLTQVHPHAQHAAEAAEAAGAQGKFWEMHDILYENQDSLEDEDLRSYADALDLDLEQFDNEMIMHVHARKIREDFMSGIRSGVNGTPAFYLNGIRYDGSWDEASLLYSLMQIVQLSGKRR